MARNSHPADMQLNLNAKQGKTSEPQISVVKLRDLTSIIISNMCFQTLPCSSGGTVSDKCFHLTVSYCSSRWLIISWNPLFPTTSSGCTSITVKFSTLSGIFVACTLLGGNVSLLSFFSFKVSCIVQPDFCLSISVNTVCSLAEISVGVS